MQNPSRRDVLKVGSTGLIASLAGCAGLDQVVDSPSTDTPSAQEMSKEELVARVRELEAIIDQKNARIEELERERGATSTPQSEFSSDVFQQAKSMALDARQAVVKLRGASGTGGTGWVLDADEGYIVTNSHVVVRDSSFEVETFDGETGRATRVGYHQDMTPDVALVQTDLTGLPDLSTGDESTLAEDDPLVTIGHPGRIGDWVMTIGRHSHSPLGMDWLLSTVPTAQGNSGGALLTLEGDVVGVVSGTTTGQGGRGEYSKTDELYAELPEVAEFTTSVPVGTLMDDVDEWT